MLIIGFCLDRAVANYDIMDWLFHFCVDVHVSQYFGFSRTLWCPQPSTEKGGSSPGKARAVALNRTVLRGSHMFGAHRLWQVIVARKFLLVRA